MKPKQTSSTVELSIAIRKAERLKFKLRPAPGGMHVTRSLTLGVREMHTMSMVFSNPGDWTTFLDADGLRTDHRSFFDQVRRAGNRFLT